MQSKAASHDYCSNQLIRFKITSHSADISLKPFLYKTINTTREPGEAKAMPLWVENNYRQVYFLHKCKMYIIFVPFLV